MADAAADADASGGAGSGTSNNGVGNAGTQAVAQLRDAKRRLGLANEELVRVKAELDEARNKAETVDNLNNTIKSLRAELAGKDEQHATERSLWAAGLVDPDEVELVKFAHGRIPEKDRPKLTDFVEGLKKDPTKAPKLLENIASRWKNTKTGAGGGSGAPAKGPRIRPNKDVVEPDDNGGGSEPTQQEWDAANQAAARGDRKLLDQLRERSGLPARQRRR